MNLILDIGNTQAKLLVFNQNKIVFKKTVASVSVKEIKSIFKKFEVTHSILAAVTEFDSGIKKYLSQNSRCILLSYKTPVPLINKYKTPKTLGLDRLANVVAGAKKFPKQNCLVIDAGTCLKFDFIDSKKNYHGGSISPGLLMRFKSLHHFTGKLPLIKSSSQKINLVGNTTVSSILSGVQNGMLAEMQHIISEYKKRFPQLNVILTGGDAPLFARALKKTIFAAPDFTATGLNEIIEHNKHPE